MMKTGFSRAAHLRLGRRGETLACRLLEESGCTILARNWRCAAGELDIVARDGTTLVFAEVKSRRIRPDRRPGENLSRRQFRRDLRAAGRFVRKYASPAYRRRFELIEVWFGRWFCRGIVRQVRYIEERSA